MVKLLGNQAANEIGMGAPDEDVLVGPVNNASQFDRVNGFISRTPSHARIVAGGKPTNRAGYFVAPTVIADLKQDDELIQSEIETVNEEIKVVESRVETIKETKIEVGNEFGKKISDASKYGNVELDRFFADRYKELY